MMKRWKLYKEDRFLLEVGVADSYFLRLRGLIGRDVVSLGGLLIKPCNQIHTFHMAYPIDVVYLSKDYEVVKIDPAVPRNKICKTVKAAKMTLELPAATARETYGLLEGDQLTIR